jgi:DNA-binding NarL/FixJ family response regulator
VTPADPPGGIRILLADDEPMFRLGIRVVLDHEPDLVVVGEAADGAQVLQLAARCRPDVVLMDLRMPGMDGIAATHRLLAGDPLAPKVVVLTTFDHDEHIYAALRAGASGFLSKRAQPRTVSNAVRTVADGQALLFPEAIRRLAVSHGPPANRRHRPPGRLTHREADVLRLMAAGLPNQQIADRLGLGTETIKTHVRAILTKTRTANRTQAVIYAYESGLLSIPDI